jgi:hypothetical protein
LQEAAPLSEGTREADHATISPTAVDEPSAFIRVGDPYGIVVPGLGLALFYGYTQISAGSLSS